jgi:hypothetical protein
VSEQPHVVQTKVGLRGTGLIVPPEQVIASLKKALAQKSDQQGQRAVTDLLRVLNDAQSVGVDVVGVIEESVDHDDERQVFSVGWYNGMEWCDTRIMRGESKWEIQANAE